MNSEQRVMQQQLDQLAREFARLPVRWNDSRGGSSTGGASGDCGCDDCFCPCAVSDKEMAAPDGVNVTELFEHIGNTSLDDLSEQFTSDGSNLHGCYGTPGDTEAPCRRVRLSGDYVGGTADNISFTLAGLTGTNAATFNGLHSGTYKSDRYHLNKGLYVYTSIRTVSGAMELKIVHSGTTIYTRALIAMPLSGTTTFNFVSSTEPGVGSWPATLNTTSSTAGSSVNISTWWRFYESVTFTPDGGPGPRLSWQHDRLHPAGLSGTVRLAIRQGGTMAFGGGSGGTLEEWFRWNEGGSEWRDCWYDFSEWDGYWIIRTQGGFNSFIPDLSVGAEPITFGIALDDARGGTEDFSATVYLDNVCIRMDTNEPDGLSPLSQTPAGTSVAFRGATAPSGWLFENGAAVSRTTYDVLFAVIGTTYGVGDGSTTFNLPDSRGRVPLSKAASGTGSILGETGGSLDHTHTVPTTGAAGSHNHGGVTGTPSATADLALTGVGATLPTTTHTHTISSQADHTHTVAATGAANMAFIAAPTIIKT